MKSRPDRSELAIVIVNWNTHDLLRNCLRSVFENLGDLDARVVVVDNASHDGSPDMVESEFPHVDLIRNDAKRGFAAANNQAIRKSREEFVLLLNSDTIVLGDVLSESVAYLKSHPVVGAMGCRVLNSDRSLQSSCFPFPSVPRLFLMAAGLHRLPVPAFQVRHRYYAETREVDVVVGRFLLVRRDAIARAGFLDEDFLCCGEATDWCRRIRESGFALHFVPVGEIIHLEGESGQSFDPKRELMLSSALVRVNQKRSGRVAAFAAWVAMAGFHLSRAIVFYTIALFSSRGETRERSHHHFEVARRFGEAWV